MKLKKEFDQYLSNIAVMIFKLHNIHWNVEGLQFHAIHNFTEEMYDELFSYFDDVAEEEKQFGVMPVSKLAEYLQLATIKEVEAKSFSTKEALELLKQDLIVLNEQATELRNASDDEGYFNAVAMLEDHVGYYKKQLWFINAMIA